MDLLKTHITGVIDHGHNYFQTYVDVGQYPHDPNLTINIILRALQRAAEMSVYKCDLHIKSALMLCLLMEKKATVKLCG